MATATKAKAKKKPKAKKPTAASKAQHLAEKIQDLRGARQLFIESSLEWQEAHAHAGELNKTMEKNQARLNGICADIDAIESGNYTPPLSFNGTMGGDGATADSEYWKTVTLAELGVNGKIGEAMAEAGLPTLGKIAEYTAKNRLTDVKGVGEKAAEKIEEACEAYWRKHPRAEVTVQRADGTTFSGTPEEAAATIVKEVKADFAKDAS